MLFYSNSPQSAVLCECDFSYKGLFFQLFWFSATHGTEISSLQTRNPQASFQQRGQGRRPTHTSRWSPAKRVALCLTEAFENLNCLSKRQSLAGHEWTALSRRLAWLNPRSQRQHSNSVSDRWMTGDCCHSLEKWNLTTGVVSLHKHRRAADHSNYCKAVIYYTFYIQSDTYHRYNPPGANRCLYINCKHIELQYRGVWGKEDHYTK